MPSNLHEVLVELFRHRPALVAELLTSPLGVPVPAFQQAHLSANDLTNVTPTEYRADAVITLADGDDPVLAVVVEVQLGTDEHKRRSWPSYVVNLHARLGCRVLLLVLCQKPAVAAWSAIPIDVGGPGLVLTPLVLGPEEVPVLTDPVLATRTPELAVLSALAHGPRPGRKEVFDALLAALEVVDLYHATLYADLVFTVLPAAAGEYLEALMTTTAPHRYQSDFARRYYNQGEAKGEAKAVLAFLDARGIEIPDQARERITGCTDLDQLDTWVRRAATVNTVDELFD